MKISVPYKKRQVLSVVQKNLWCKCGAKRIKEKRKYLIFKYLRFILVIRLGLEPKTPTLKVLCSTC